MQPNLSVQDKLVALRNREDVLRVVRAAEDKALAAKQSIVLKQSRDSTKCKFCQRGPYNTDDYEFRKTFNKVIEAFAHKQIRRLYKSDRCVYSQKRDQYLKGSIQPSYKKTDCSNRLDRPYCYNYTDCKTEKLRSEKREYSYAANKGYSIDESPDDYSITDSSDNNKLVEYVHLIHNEIYKIPYSYWCSDSCALLYITDNKSLFRSPLIPIRQRTILVGGS
jgi:hypothetical protein